jgi:hypothetical protein
VELIPPKLTPHSLRRTFASILVATGEDPRYVMGQMGHTTAGFTLSIYAREMDRRDGELNRLPALVAGRTDTSEGENSGSQLAAAGQKIGEGQSCASTAKMPCQRANP